MTEEPEVSTNQNAPRLVYALPRVRITTNAYSVNEVAVSRARIVWDTDENWIDVVGHPRPNWLDIYQDGHDGVARGTLIVSDDDEWLSRHIQRVLSIIYVMGLPIQRWGTPSEAFRIVPFTAKASPEALVCVHTKTRRCIESADSIRLPPPIELRAVQHGYQVDVNDSCYEELLRRFRENPYDRLVTACYHLFRTQFENWFLGPSEHDAAAYCACLEAALDVPERDYAETVARRLVSFYNEPALGPWVRGLYTERSLFNHGITADPTATTTDQREHARRAYNDQPGNWQLLRQICEDVIRDQLQISWDEQARLTRRLLKPVCASIRSTFHSDAIWRDLSRTCKQTDATKVLRALTGDALEDVRNLFRAYVRHHKFGLMRTKLTPDDVCDVLMRLASLIGEQASEDGNEAHDAAAKELFAAASDRDHNRICSWASGKSAWAHESHATLEAAARAAAIRTVDFFAQ